MRSLTFAGRLLLVAFVPAMLVAVMMTLYFIVHSVRDSEHAEMQRALSLAQGLSRAAEFGVATSNQVILQEAAQPILAVPSIHVVRYYGPGDEPVYEVYDPDHRYADISTFARFARSLFSEQRLSSRVSASIQRTDLTLYEDPLFVDITDSQSPGQEQVIGWIELDVDLSLAYKDQYETVGRVFFFVALVLAIALAAAYRLAQSVIVPVRFLTASVRSLALKDYVQVPPVRIGGELDELARGINHLSGELQSFHAQQSEAIRQATSGLQETLTLLEARNAELEQARASAEKASAFKSQFVANMSHEIRTPLNAIIGTLSVMNKTGLDITQVDQFDMIRNSSKTLLYLVEDILDISKIESGNLVVESISTNLESLLADVSGTAAMQAVERGIELYVSPIPDLSLRDTYTDPLRLKQVLLNLLSNSIKFTHTGHVALLTDIQDSRPGHLSIRFTVQDTGIGIPEDKQQNLFSAFTQVDMSTTRRYGGTGLGLFISSGIVKLLGGTISLSSKEGKGTRIEVVLPLTVSRNAAIQPPLSTAPVDGVSYMDHYEPLAELNRQLINTAFSRVLASDPDRFPGRVCVNHIPNRLLANSWLKPEGISCPVIDGNDRGGTVNVAWISQITPLTKTQLEKAGYTGYVVRTPSLIQLKRNIQVALSGQCFRKRTSGTQSYDRPDDRSDYRSDDRPGKALQALTVLAVDDQSINIDLLMQYLDYLDIRGIYAASGSEALAYIESEAIDLVLLDLHMPELDGFEVAERIRASGSVNAQVPIIAMTADAYQSTREKALSAGFDGLLTKPATVQQVSDTILNWTNQERVPETAKTTAIVDIKACAEAVRGNEEWARGALKTYALEIPGHVAELQRALHEHDLSALFEVAHAVKGVSRLFQIHPVANAAEALEKECCNADGTPPGKTYVIKDGTGMGIGTGTGTGTGTGSESLRHDWNQIEYAVQELERLLHRAGDECAVLLA